MAERLDQNMLSTAKRSLLLGTGLMLANLVISTTLIATDFDYSAESYSLAPKNSLGFGQTGSIWFALMIIGWLAAILIPLGVFVVVANRTLTVGKLGFSSLLRTSVLAIWGLLCLELAWTPGAALSVLFVATLGRGEFSNTSIMLAPIECRVLTSFGAAIGLCTTTVFAAILGTFLGGQFSKLWSALTVGFASLLPVLILMLAGSNDALVAGICLTPTPFAAFLAVFTLIGPSILTGGLIWLGYRNMSDGAAYQA